MKHIPTIGHQIVLGQVVLTPSGLTGLLVPNGISGNATNVYLDVYSVTITSNDTTVDTIMLSDGVTALTYYVGGSSTSPAPPVIDGGWTVPTRFRQGAPLMTSASAITTAKSVSVIVRGIYTST